MSFFSLTFWSPPCDFQRERLSHFPTSCGQLGYSAPSTSTMGSCYPFCSQTWLEPQVIAFKCRGSSVMFDNLTFVKCSPRGISVGSLFLVYVLPLLKCHLPSWCDANGNAWRSRLGLKKKEIQTKARICRRSTRGQQSRENRDSPRLCTLKC